MPNQYVVSRLRGIQGQLMSGYAANSAMSSSSKGAEREAFIGSFMRNVMPPIYRFGSGDATDVAGNRSGQLDVVIEYPFGPSLPAVGQEHVRLYLAETVGAVIEVKSDVAGQWNEVLGTADKLSVLDRNFGTHMSFGYPPSAKIPLFAVGYRGWKTSETVREKLAENPNLFGILVLESGLYASRTGHAGGTHGLWAFICDLQEQLGSLQSAQNSPMDYIAS